MKNDSNVGILCETAGRPIDKVREFFTAPQGDEEKIISLIGRLLKKIDTKKEGPIIARKKEVSYDELLQGAAFPEKLSSEEEVMDALTERYEGVILWSHPSVQINVIPPPTTVSIAAAALTARYNENAIWDNYGRNAAQSEVLATGMLADLIGFDRKQVGGLFTFGGTGCNLYGARIGIEKAIPAAKYTGIRERIHFFCSDVSHYSIKTAAIWTGIGLDNVKIIPTDDNGVMDMDKLAAAVEATISEGAKVGTIFATMGTTDSFSIDPLSEIVALRDRIRSRVDYDIHVHADAVIGWSYLTFRGDTCVRYLPLPLREEVLTIVSKMTDLKLADSVGLDFHKTGWSPYLCSAFVVKNQDDLLLLQKTKKDMPYLYHGSGYQPGTFTLESSRPNYAQQALVNMMLLGKEGYEALIVHLLTVADYLRERIEASRDIVLLNRNNPAFVTDFRIYPETKHTETGASLFEQELHDLASSAFTERINDYNRQIALQMIAEFEEKGTTSLSYTDSYKTTSQGRMLLAVKSFPMSPFIEKGHMDQLLMDLYRAKAQVDASLAAQAGRNR